MSYEFGNLSPAVFEDLVRDLIGRELGVRFEAFATGPDGGMDGRHSKGGATILQAKHHARSTYAALRRQMKRERRSIDHLSPDRYVLATSRPISPLNKHELSALIGPSLKSESDILGPQDLNALLRMYPEIEKAHIKLWLSGSAVLERVLRSAAYMFNRIAVSEIEAKVRIYAPNPSFSQARETLEDHHVVIISGPPGVGKTTLAEMLSYAYVAEGWNLIAIRSLDDGLASTNDQKRQIFFFDDFLGKVALDRRALSHKDSDLARFIRRIRNSPNARFILTTRAYLFEEARRVSEHLADQRLDITKYTLDVGIYTRRVRARILYNHLLVAETPQSHIAALVADDKIAKIVDHKNYNPRVIEWMTDITRIGTLKPEVYPAAFLKALDQPGRLWDIAFRTHISTSCRHLLIALFFCSEYGAEIENLRASYDEIHGRLSRKYGESYDPKDYEASLRVLEGGFITIGRRVNFVNPSLRDYMTEYLDDRKLLQELANAARLDDWAQAVWQHGQRLELSSDDLRSFAFSFLGVAKEFLRLPVWIHVRDDSGHFRYYSGLSNTSRIELLVAWWEASRDQRFSDLALALARAPVDGLDSWRDGEDAVELVGKLRDGGYFDDFPCAVELAKALEEALIDMIGSGIPTDDLEKISDAIERWKILLDAETTRAVEDAVRRELEDVPNVVADIDSESTLNEHIETLERLAKRAGVPSHEVERAIAVVMDRIAEVGERSEVSQSPSFKGPSSAEPDAFDDLALKNLFAPLVCR